ncbi:MAG: nicotinate (nicotinamide) nucleotide adenylyltransferase [Rhodoferax sp.]|nr:nicotinate (nicotinamide) nucleotide adenylyltransferase [Rhodoferax sp.]
MGVSKKTASPQRIGVLGGAFDPPHVVHVALAEAACAELNLDVLHVIPTGDAWHKTRTLTAAEHRVAMSQLAFSNVPQAVVDTREITRSGPTYTVDTLRELKAEYPDAQLYLIMGADQARALTSWRDWEEVTRLAIICVAARAPSAGANGAIRTEFGADFPPGVEVHRIAMPVSDLSATRIRTQLAAHTSVSPLVFEPVARYIALHHLYLTP